MTPASLLSHDLCKRLAFELVWGKTYMSRSEIELRVAKFLERIGRSESQEFHRETNKGAVHGNAS